MRRILFEYTDRYGYSKLRRGFSLAGFVSLALMDAAFWISIGYLLGTRL